MCGGQRPTVGSCFSPPVVWDLGIEFRLSGSYNPLPIPHLVKFSEPWRGDTNVPHRDEHSAIIYFQHLDWF